MISRMNMENKIMKINKKIKHLLQWNYCNEVFSQARFCREGKTVQQNFKVKLNSNVWRPGGAAMVLSHHQF